MSYSALNFRATAGYVTDPAGSTYVLRTDAYGSGGVTRAGLTFGHAMTAPFALDVNSSFDPAIAGAAIFNTYANQFRINLAKGQYRFKMGIGHQGVPGPQSLCVWDGAFTGAGGVALNADDVITYPPSGTPVAAGKHVVRGGNLYVATNAGATGGTPPTGTATSDDGTVRWQYVRSALLTVSGVTTSEARVLDVRGTALSTAAWPTTQAVSPPVNVQQDFVTVTRGETAAYVRSVQVKRVNPDGRAYYDDLSEPARLQHDVIREEMGRYFDGHKGQPFGYDHDVIVATDQAFDDALALAKAYAAANPNRWSRIRLGTAVFTGSKAIGGDWLGNGEGGLLIEAAGGETPVIKQAWRTSFTRGLHLKNLRWESYSSAPFLNKSDVFIRTDYPADLSKLHAVVVENCVLDCLDNNYATPILAFYGEIFRVKNCRIIGALDGVRIQAYRALEVGHTDFTKGYRGDGIAISALATNAGTRALLSPWPDNQRFAWIHDNTMRDGRDQFGGFGGDGPHTDFIQHRTSFKAWEFGTSVAIGQVRNVGSRMYQAINDGGTTAGPAPSHTSGTAMDGTVNWAYVGERSQFVMNLLAHDNFVAIDGVTYSDVVTDDVDKLVTAGVQFYIDSEAIGNNSVIVNNMVASRQARGVTNDGAASGVIYVEHNTFAGAAITPLVPDPIPASPANRNQERPIEDWYVGSTLGSARVHARGNIVSRLVTSNANPSENLGSHENNLIVRFAGETADAAGYLTGPFTPNEGHGSLEFALARTSDVSPAAFRADFITKMRPLPGYTQFGYRES